MILEQLDGLVSGEKFLVAKTRIEGKYKKLISKMLRKGILITGERERNRFTRKL